MVFVNVFRCGCKLLRPERGAEGSMSVFVEVSNRLRVCQVTSQKQTKRDGEGQLPELGAKRGW